MPSPPSPVKLLKTEDGSGRVQVVGDVVHAQVLQVNSLSIFPLGEVVFRDVREGGIPKVCFVVEIASATPPPEVYRKELERFYERMAPALHGVAFVVKADGFGGSIARSIFTGLNLLSRRPYATTVVGTLEEAVRWITRALPASPMRPSADELLRLLSC